MLDVPKREVELGAGLREIPQPGKVDATKGISGPIRNSILRNLKYVGIVRQAFINLAKNVQECRGLDMSWRDEEVLASYASRFKLHDDPNVRNRTWEHRLVDHEFFLESLLAPENDNPQIVTAFQRSGANLNQQRPGLRALKAKFLPSDRNVMFIDIGPGLGNEKPAITSQEIADRFPAVEVIALDTPSRL